MLGRDSTFNNSVLFARRVQAEPLLRRTIHSLYSQQYISSSKSIIDIGCWLADNSLVWANHLTDSAKVIAVDPSNENISFGKKLAYLNDVNNIHWVTAVCSDQENISLSYEGSINHTRFSNEPVSENYLVSTTLDAITTQAGNPAIGLLHIDVEWMEYNVIRGAQKLIKKDKPVITFEQHISTEDALRLAAYVKGLGYRVFLINEVLPGCALDCRNFIALDAQRRLPLMPEFNQKNACSLGIYSATLGPALIEI